MLVEQNDLERLPQAALEIRDGTVCAMNAAAQEQLPYLNQGSPVPPYLAQSISAGQRAGSFAEGEETFLFTRVTSPNRELILFRPAQDCAVTGAQLEGFSRLMRSEMGGLLNQLDRLCAKPDGSSPELPTQTSHSFHKMLRLVGNLEFLNIPEQEAQAALRPVTMDLAGLCMQLVRQAAPMLRKANVDLRYISDCTGLLIPGDPEMLQRMLLGLISNAAKASPGGTVTLDLRPWMNRAVLSVSDDACGEPVDLSALFKDGSSRDIPAPDDGAGMGLSVVRRIAALHGGTLLTRQSKQGGLVFTVSLPVDPLPAGLPLHTPKVESNGGLSPFLVELADLLPAELFQPDVD